MEIVKMTDYFKYTARTLTEEESHKLINRLFNDNIDLTEKNNILKKELEDIKDAFKLEHDDNILRRDRLSKLSDNYIELKKEYEDLQERQNAWVKCKERNDELKKTLEAKNEEIERLHKKKNDQRVQLNAVQQALLNRNMTIEALTGENDRLKKEVKERRVVFEPTSNIIDMQAKNEEIKTLRKKNLDLKNENEGLRTKLAYSEENADRAKSVSDDILRRDYEINQLKIQNRMLEISNKRLLEKSLDLEKDISSANKRVTAYKGDYYRVLNAYCDLRAKYEPTQPINIENLNVTYYANGPVWTNDDSDEEETADTLAAFKEED